jgi:hypothetical protein
MPPVGIVGQANQTGKGPYRTAGDANWKGALAVGCGDLVYADTGDVNAASEPYDKTAGQLAWGGSLATTQTTFKGLFRGVSTVRRTTLQTVDGSKTADGPIITSGEFKFPCAALGSVALVGALVGPAKATGNALDGTSVAIVTNVSYAIGKVTQFAPVGQTFLVFEIYPFLFDSGVQAQA